MIVTGRYVTEGNAIRVRYCIPRIFEPLQHIGIFYLVDECIVLYIKSNIEAILHIIQLYFRLPANVYHFFITSRIP